MSRTALTASHPPRAKKKRPVPPPGGWTLMEAAEILCPEAVALYRQGGEALEAAVSQDQHRLSARAKRSPEIRPGIWLTLQLLDALGRRPDLQLTGRNALASGADRAQVPADVLRNACERDNRDDTIYRRWVHIDFRDDRASSGRDFPPTHFDPAPHSHWADVRVEASSGGLVADRLGLPDSSLRPGGRSPVLRPLRFALDAASECVLFEGGVKLRGQSARLVGELLPRFLEGAKAGRGPEGYGFVGSRPLSRSLGITRESLRRRVARLREDLAGQFRSVHAATLLEDDFIENRPWAGYRLNPFLIVDASLLRAAAAASGHVTHPDADVTPFG